VSDGPASLPGTERTLRTLRLGVFATLCVCALVIAGSASGVPPDHPPSIGYSGTAIGLAVGSILCRLWANGPRRSERLEKSLVVASLALAGAIGIVAVLLTLAEDQWRAGLFYILAGAMLSIRIPSVTRAAPPEA